MLSLLKSILPNFVPQRVADKPELPKEWAIATGGDKPQALEGNFCDVFSPDGRGVTFLIGEVSASGARAATLVNLIHGAARAAGQEAGASQINRVLCDQDRYAAVFWTQFDPETRLLHFINAGQVPPLLFKANRRPMVRLEPTGPGFGVFPNATYSQGSAALDPGDILVMYSNGIVEACDESGENFGEDRLITVVELSRNIQISRC